MIPEWTREIIRQHATPLTPIATGLSDALAPRLPVKAVLWDVYGTLLISGVGDIGVSAAPGEAAAEVALRACGVAAPGCGAVVARRLREVIAISHEKDRRRGVNYPEVVIEEVWRETLTSLRNEGVLGREVAQVDLMRLSLEYEMRVNPVWPMPHATESLAAFAAAGWKLGIISNAQWFTPVILEVLLGRPLHELGFSDESLLVYSYQHRRAKPSRELFQAALDELAQESILAREVLYIGNDRLNDCWGAARAGMRTALFAGDRRSLRLREDMPELHDVEPDWVVTDLRRFTAACLADHRETGAH